MNTLPAHLREDLLNYIPSYIFEETSCFVFADKHPMGKKTVDITVCTYKLSGSALVMEFSERVIVSSVVLNCTSKPTQITSSRNKNCDLFYVVSAGDELFILNGEKLEVMRKICNVMVFDLANNMSSGEGTLRVMSSDHVNALEFDDSFNIVQETPGTDLQGADSPAMTNLQRKLTAAQFNLAHNMNLIEDYGKLRVSAAFKMLKEMHPSLSDAVFKSGCNKMAADLRIKIQSQWMKTFNNKLVIVLELQNETDVQLENLNILIQDHNMPTMVYKTKIFEETSTPPYWSELTTKCFLKQNRLTSIITLIDIKELENNVTSRIEFNALLLYKTVGKEKYLPLKKTKLTAKDIREESFNLLNSSLDKKEMLAILAASIKTDLIIQHIKITNEIFHLQDLLEKIGMEKVASYDNVFVYRKSPYDVLNGVMVVIPEHSKEGPINVTVYTRKESQVLYLINLMQDTTDKRIVITTPNHRIEAKRAELEQYNQIPTESTKHIDVEKYAKSLLKQVTITKEYYEDCMAKMHESNNENVLNNIGKAVDIFACGRNTFDEFKSELVSEMSHGVDVMNETFIDVRNEDDNLMVVESEEF